MKNDLLTTGLNGRKDRELFLIANHKQQMRLRIQNQEMHHHKLSFLDEYKKFLEKFEVDFDERYIFKAPE